MNDIVSWEYPDELFDKDGYPTPEALDYIKNWSIIWGVNEDMTKCGKYFGTEENYDHLIDYLKALWCYSDGVVYWNGLLELHTMGWSGNEEIIAELKKTNLWLLKFSAHQAGGHYYFKIDKDAEEDWWIVRSIDKS